MNIEGSSALVTGANRGLGAAYVSALLDRGAAKVYAAVRRPETITDPRVVPIRFDLTDPVTIRDAAEVAADTTLLINNAGISTGASILGDDAAQRDELEVNYLGPLAVSRSFAPVLAANGGNNTNVIAVHVGYMDTDMTAGVTAPKTAPMLVAQATLDAVGAGHHEVLADEPSRQVRAALSATLATLYPSLPTTAA
jgi:NAD(P)-dependent dehydrogenase (short-subunit alcohol dehydrogenase family)